MNKEQEESPVVAEEVSSVETGEPKEQPEVVSKEEYARLLADYKGVQKAAMDKANALRQAEDRINTLSSNQEMWQAAMAALAYKEDTTPDEAEDGLRETKPDRLKQMQQIVAEQQLKQEWKQFSNQAQSIWEEATKYGSRDDNDVVEKIYDILQIGSAGDATRRTDAIQRASAKLEKLKNQTLKQEAKVVDESEIEKKAEELANKKLEKAKEQWMEEHGLYPKNTVAPSGGATGGKKPTLEELQASDPFETQKKIKSGEWVL